MKRFSQVDVFTDEFCLGNPVAVVHDADGIAEKTMAAFARWTNLSETTFLLPPSDPTADYRLRIFTPGRELPFAGHPTLGSARAWLAAGGRPNGETITQQCGAGLITIRRDGDRLAFAAPPLRRGGPVESGEVDRLTRGVGLESEDVVDAQWCDNGPGWVALLLRDADAVLRARPDPSVLGDDCDLGLAGPHKTGVAGDGGDADIEVRAFVIENGGPVWEDPVTGSLNAALGQWLTRVGHLPHRYVAAQGTALARRGRVHVERDGEDVWVGGDAVVGVTGVVTL